MAREVAACCLLVTLPALSACVAQPTLISPYNAPIALPLNHRVQTYEPERLVCTTRAALICTPVLAVRIHGAARDCVCAL
jgi:hypothetical protein